MQLRMIKMSDVWSLQMLLF